MRIFSGYPPLPQSFATLTRREHGFLAAAAEATFPRGGAIEPSGVEAEIPRYVDRYLGVLPARMRLLMRLLFFLVEHATLFFPAGGPAGLRRFSKLPQPARVAYLQSWQRSGFHARRVVFTGLRSILTLGYLADAEVLRALRLAPKQIDTPVCEADLLWPRVGERPEQIRYTLEDLTPPSDGSPLDPDAPLDPDYQKSQP